MTASTLSKRETQLIDSCIAVLKRIEEPLSCVALGRLCHAESSEIYRLLSNDSRLIATKGEGLTVFRVRAP